MKRLLLTLLTISPFFISAQETFEYTGDKQTYVVPECVAQIEFEVIGASGFTQDPAVALPGNGGRVTGKMDVTPGQTLYIHVGGEGILDVPGFNGGGSSGTGTAGMGGGASDIRVIDDFYGRMVVAGGGGGAGSTYQVNNHGGHGGDMVGLPGNWNNNYNSSYCGLGGTQTAGGKGAAGSARNGSFGQGGNATYHGGGGGGGWYGGGAGNGATTCCTGGGGGGGSSYTHPSIEEFAHEQGVNTGNGKVVITPILGATRPVAIYGDSLGCAGDTLTFSTDTFENSQYVWTFPGGTEIINDTGYAQITVILGDSSGTVSVSVANSCGESLPRFDTLISRKNIQVSITKDTTICIGDSIQLQAAGGDTFLWDPPVNITCNFCPNPIAFPETDITYTVYVSDTLNSCASSASVNITLDSCKIDTVPPPPTSAQAIIADEIKVYPNPSTGVFNFENLPKNTSVIEVYDSFGKIIASLKPNEQIDLSKHADGMYLIRVKSADNSQQFVRALKTN